VPVFKLTDQVMPGEDRSGLSLISYVCKHAGLYDPPIYPSASRDDLFVILLSFIVNNIEEPEFVDTLGSRDNAKPIPQLLLLEELLRQVLEVSSRKLSVCNNLDLAVTLLRDLNGITEVANTAVDLDFVLKELLEGGDIEDLVAGGLRSVDDELLRDLGLLAL